jgi:hypothetical protein
MNGKFAGQFRSFILAMLGVLGIVALPAQAAEPAGKTLLSIGAVTSQRGSTSVALKRRSPVYEKDKIQVAANSKAQLRMADDALISLQQNSVLQISQYRYQKGKPGNSALLELLSGGMRTITGAIGKNNKKAYELRTPLATIGIRGTDYEVQIVANGMYVAVWDGIIHLRSLLRNGCDMELGRARKFSYIFIDRFGQCRGLDKVPDVFQSNYSFLPDELMDSAGKQNLFPYRAFTVKQTQAAVNGAGRSSAIDSDTPTFLVGKNQLNFSGDNVTDYQQSVGGYALTWGYWNDYAQNGQNATARNVIDDTGDGLIWSTYQATPASAVMSRTGSVRYDSVSDSLLSASAGPVSNLQVQMDVDFDSGKVSNGAISANTPQETWIGVFDGQVENGDLGLQLNGASVVDSNPSTPSPPRDASGFIDGDFIGDRAQGVTGAFGFSETNNSSNHIEGVFLLE